MDSIRWPLLPSMEWTFEVGGVLILHDGKLHGGDSYVYYAGPTTVPMASGRVK